MAYALNCFNASSIVVLFCFVLLCYMRCLTRLCVVVFGAYLNALFCFPSRYVCLASCSVMMLYVALLCFDLFDSGCFVLFCCSLPCFALLSVALLLFDVLRFVAIHFVFFLASLSFTMVSLLWLGGRAKPCRPEEPRWEGYLRNPNGPMPP